MKLKCRVHNHIEYDYDRSTFYFNSKLSTKLKNALKIWFSEFNNVQTKLICMNPIIDNDGYHRFTETFGTIRDFLTSEKISELVAILEPRDVGVKITRLGYRSVINRRLSIEHPFRGGNPKIISHKHIDYKHYLELNKSDLFYVQAVWIYWDDSLGFLDFDFEILDPRIYFLYPKYLDFRNDCESEKNLYEWDDRQLRGELLPSMDKLLYKMIKRLLNKFANNGDYTNWFKHNDIKVSEGNNDNN